MEVQNNKADTIQVQIYEKIDTVDEALSTKNAETNHKTELGENILYKLEGEASEEGDIEERQRENNAELKKYSDVLKETEFLGQPGNSEETVAKSQGKLLVENENEVENVDEQFTAMVEQSRTFMANNKKLRQLVKQLEEDVNTRGKENVQLENANKELNLQVEKLNNQVTDLKEEITLRNNTLEEVNKTCDKYAETNYRLESEVDRLNREMDTKEGDNAKTNQMLKQEIIRLEEFINAVSEEKKNLDAEKKELVIGKNNLYAEVERIKTIVKTMSEESKRIAETNKNLQLEKKKQMEQLTSATEQNKALKEKVENLNEKLSTGLQEEIDDILSLGHYLDTQGKKYIIVEEDIETKRGEELNELQEQVKQLQDDKKLLEEMIENTEVQKSMLSVKVNKLNDEKAKVENSIDVLRKEKERIQMELRSDNQKLKSEFMSMLKDIEEQLAAKIKESDAIDEEKEALADELTNLEGSKRKLELEINIMENVIVEQVKKIDDLSTKCYLSKELEFDLQSKTQLIESLYEENDLLRREAEYKDEEVEDMSRKCEVWSTLVEERFRAYDIMKNKYNAQHRFVKFATSALDRERKKRKRSTMKF